MLVRLFVCMCALWLTSAAARAEDAVECDKSQEACDAQILQQCPTGADVLEEKIVDAKVPRYRIVFRCRGAGASEAPGGTAPAPAPNDAPATDAPVPPPITTVPSSGAAAELEQVELRLAELQAERSRHSLVGPLILTGAGFGTSFVLMAVALSAYSDAETLEDGGYIGDFDDDDFDTDPPDEDAYRTTARVTGVMSALAAGVGVGGLVWLMKRVKARKANKPEMDELKERQRILKPQVSYAFSVDPNSRTLVLSGRF